jgi:hypothetical protein
VSNNPQETEPKTPETPATPKEQRVIYVDRNKRDWPADKDEITLDELLKISGKSAKNVEVWQRGPVGMARLVEKDAELIIGNVFFTAPKIINGS